MAYFIIVLGVVVWLILVGVATMVTRLVPIFKGAYPYVWRGGVGSALGIIAANLALVVVLAFGFMIFGKISTEHDGVHDIARLILGLSATIGPLIASLVGWLVGGVGGLLIANRSCRMTPSSQVKSEAAP